MPRQSFPNKIKAHRIYTVWEAADALSRYRQSIIRWIKEKGLIADTSCKPASANLHKAASLFAAACATCPPPSLAIRSVCQQKDQACFAALAS